MNESKSRPNSPMWARWQAAHAVQVIEHKPTPEEQREISLSVLTMSEFPRVVSAIIGTYPDFHPDIKIVTWDKKGKCPIRGLKGVPSSTGLAITWGKEDYPEISYTEGLIGKNVSFYAAVVEVGRDGLITVRGREQESKQVWDEKEQRLAIKHALEHPEYVQYVDQIDKSKSDNYLVAAALVGQSIQGTAAELALIAKFTGRQVITEFNGIGILINPGDKPQDVVKLYNEEMDKKHNRSLLAPNGAVRERRSKRVERKLDEFTREKDKYTRVVEEVAEVKIGEMPKPCYLLEGYNTALDSDMERIKWVGIVGFSPEKELKDFIWWRNFKAGDLSKEEDWSEVAALIARIKLETGADAAVGLAVDLANCDSEYEAVDTYKEDGVLGVYIEAPKRAMFNFMVMMQGIKSEEQLRAKRPDEFERVYRQALEVLPNKDYLKKEEKDPVLPAEKNIQSFPTVKPAFG
jgi:hypothetical protein